MWAASSGKSEGVRVLARLWDNFKQFVLDVKAEVKKVSFPGREETTGSTLVVIVFCLVMSIYLSVVDSFLVWLVSKVI